MTTTTQTIATPRTTKTVTMMTMRTMMTIALTTKATMMMMPKKLKTMPIIPTTSYGFHLLPQKQSATKPDRDFLILTDAAEF